jgi:hypothetical protein
MKTGAAVFKFSKGRIGTSGANVGYITREKAAGNRVWPHNIPLYATEGETRKERIDNLREYARQQEENELEKLRTGSGETRTHYRAIYSFDREITDEQGRRMVEEHLEKNFSDVPRITVLHRDSAHTHLHVWIEARGSNEKKINLSNKQYKTLDDDFALICAKEFDERNLYDDHINKKIQTQQWKRDYAEAKQRGENTPEKPIRAADERDQIQERRAMEAQQFGATYYDETRIRTNQRPAISTEPTATTGESAINRAEREIDALNRSIAETNRAIEQANQQKQITRDYDDERER